MATPALRMMAGWVRCKIHQDMHPISKPCPMCVQESKPGFVPSIAPPLRGERIEVLKDPK